MKLLDFAKHFDSEEACEKYLKETREKEGIKCSRCGCEKQYWNRCHKRWMCAKCGHETTLRSGTVMHGSNLPLLYWFTAIHLLTSTKKTFSAAEMQRQLGHKRYQPIWEMMHKLRSVMGERDSKYNLEGTIELDEAILQETTILQRMKMRTRTKRGDLAANASRRCSLWWKARRRTNQSLAKRAVNAVI